MTLVELLVAIAIIGVLLAIVLVGLSRAKVSQEDLVELRNLRATMVDFVQWGNDHEDICVNAGIPGTPGSEWWYGDMTPQMATGQYRAQVFYWPRVLHTWLGESREHWHSAAGVGTLNGQVDPDQWSGDPGYWSLPSRYRYTETLLTAAQIWQAQLPPLHGGAYAAYFQHVRWSDVSYPSGKGVLAHRERAGDPVRWHVAFADGSCSIRDPLTAKATAPHPTSNDRDRVGLAVACTWHGYTGVDF